MLDGEGTIPESETESVTISGEEAMWSEEGATSEPVAIIGGELPCLG